MPKRRHLLAATGVAVAAAGCMGVFEDDSPSGSAEAATGDESVVLEELSVQNNNDTDHTIQIAVEADGEVLHLGTYPLDADGGSTRIQDEWDGGADSYRVHARLDDEEIQAAAVTCGRVLIRVDDDAELAIWNDAGCD